MAKLQTEKKMFIKITNEDIYREIMEIRKDLNNQKTKIKVNQWISTTALSLVVGMIIGIVVT